MGCHGSKSGNKNKEKPAPSLPGKLPSTKALQIPEGLDVSQYKKPLMRFSGTMDLIGDISSLPPRTQQYISKLQVAKNQIDTVFENMNDYQQQQKDLCLYKMFTRYSEPINQLMLYLLNDQAFNQANPIIRETFKEIYHIQKKLQDELVALQTDDNKDPNQNLPKKNSNNNNTINDNVEVQDQKHINQENNNNNNSHSSTKKQSSESKE